jgi:hypothetical protein
LNRLRPSLRATQKFGQLNQIPHFGQLFRIKNRPMFWHELSAHILSPVYPELFWGGASPRDLSSRSLHSANAQRQTAILRLAPFHSSLPTFNSFLFILMQTPFSATPLFSYSYKCPGGCGYPSPPAGSATPLRVVHFCSLHPFYSRARQLISFLLNVLRTLRKNNRGVPSFFQASESHRASCPACSCGTLASSLFGAFSHGQAHLLSRRRHRPS